MPPPSLPLATTTVASVSPNLTILEHSTTRGTQHSSLLPGLFPSAQERSARLIYIAAGISLSLPAQQDYYTTVGYLEYPFIHPVTNGHFSCFPLGYCYWCFPDHWYADPCSTLSFQVSGDLCPKCVLSVCECECARMWGWPESNLRCSSSAVIHFLFEMGSLISLEL